MSWLPRGVRFSSAAFSWTGSGIICIAQVVHPHGLHVSFSLSPNGLVEVSSAMRATVPEEPYQVFAATWAKVGMCLWDARFLATASDRRVLARLEALTVLGIWDATALDVLHHPKIPGYCLVRARDPPEENLCRWTYLVQSADWFQEECVAAAKC